MKLKYFTFKIKIVTLEENNLIIGVDVDGVLTDLYSYVDKECENFAKKHNFVVKRNLIGKNTKDMFGWNDEQDNLFWQECIFDYGQKTKRKTGASEILKHLKEQGHIIYIVTARRYCTNHDEIGEKSKSILLKWLSDNEICYDKIFFTEEGKSKVPQIKENHIDIFIDDSVHNLQEIADEEIPVICMNEPYNQMFEHKNMIRCQNWEDVLFVINKMDKEAND